MVLIPLLLPATDSRRGRAHDYTAFARTRQELAAKFDGLTAYLRSPSKGVWTAPDGHTCTSSAGCRLQSGVHFIRQVPAPVRCGSGPRMLQPSSPAPTAKSASIC